MQRMKGVYKLEHLFAEFLRNLLDKIQSLQDFNGAPNNCGVMVGDIILLGNRFNHWLHLGQVVSRHFREKLIDSMLVDTAQTAMYNAKYLHGVQFDNSIHP